MLHAGRIWRVAVIAALPLGSVPLICAEWDISNTGLPSTQATFTVSEGTWMNLDVHPDGRTLVFDLLGDIYSVPAEGGDATLIHGGPAIETQPRFSPDGSKILYISDRGGSDNLWVSGVDGAGARQISRETTLTLAAPAWDADGRYVAATRFAPQPDKLVASEIVLYHANGGAGRILVETPASRQAVHEPRFSPDGRYLYYTEHMPGTSPSMFFVNANQPVRAIRRRNLADGRVESELRGFGSATSAQLSADDRRIAFIRRVKDKTVLFVHDTQTGSERPIYDGLERDLHAHWNPRSAGYFPQFNWYPDNRHVAIWSKGKLLKIDVDTRARTEIPFRVTAQHRITIPPRFENPIAPERFVARAIRHLAASPDGRTIAFSALGHLWHKRLPHGKPERLTRGSDFEFEPSYSSDGRYIAYVTWNDERSGALAIMTADGRHVRTLVQGAGIVRQPVFSRDGSKLVYWLEAGNPRMGGYRTTKPGLYSVAVAGGTPRHIAPAGQHPRFSPDGNRVYYLSKAGESFGAGTGNVLLSVNLDGQEPRRHVSGPHTDELRISPDLTWLVYKQDLQYFLVPYRETGVPLELPPVAEASSAIRLTRSGGHEITWSADSSRVQWLMGESLFGARVNELSAANAAPEPNEATVGLEIPADKPEGTLAFINARIITMRGDEVIERGSLIVQGNRIHALGSAEALAIPKSAKVIDVAGKTVLPGFIDMHGHLEIAEDDVLTPMRHPAHYAALAFGVTTNFDPSTNELPSFALSEMNLAGVTVGPRAISAGRIIYGMELPGWFHPINGGDDARRIIARKKAVGAVIVKSYMQPMRSQRQQLIKAASEAGLMVTPEGEHFHQGLSMILDGHVSIEHGLPLANYYDDVIQLLSRGRTSITPTLIVTSGEAFAENYFYQTTRPWDDPKVKRYVQTTMSALSPLGGAGDAPPHARGMVSIHQPDELWEIGFRSTARSLKRLDDAGGVVTTGTHGQIHGLGIHWEMWALAEGGMSHRRVLRAATLNGARTLGLEKQIGTLEPGKLADLIVLDANPLDDIRNTNTVRYTMVNGRLYDALTMNEIGNYPRARGKFYWEVEEYGDIDWNEAWRGTSLH